MIKLEIDGKPCSAEAGEMLIQVADREGIYIPRFCYHKKLSVAANCRMCLVEMEGGRKPMPACATPVADGMKFLTKSEEALRSQRYVMEFLLINHPLDCPICDQGGECELQDVAMGYGKDSSRFTEGKRAVADDNLGSLIATHMTRCIHCTRCIRFGEEIAGVPELGMTGRGEESRVGTYIEKSLISEVSGNVIDLCPVGALTSKPYRYTARSWELEEQPALSPHDCLGTNLNVHTRRGEVMRVVPRENEQINETWISDRDRFSYLGLQEQHRLLSPCVKENGQWREVDWQTAFTHIADRLAPILKHGGAEQLAGLISPSATLEEQYLLQRLLRSMGCHNIDHRLHQTDFSDQATMPAFPGLSEPLAEIEHAPAILLVGSDVQREQPLFGLRLRKAAARGAQIVAVNPIDFNFNFTLADKFIVAPTQLDIQLAEIAKALLDRSEVVAPAGAEQLLANVVPSPQAKTTAELFLTTQRGAVIIGELAQNCFKAARTKALAQLISQLADMSFGMLTAGSNSAGAWLSGCVPHRGPAAAPLIEIGLDTVAQLRALCKAYFLYGFEPDLDLATPSLASQAFAKAELVVAFSAFNSPSLAACADVILPIAPFTETSGTFVNVEGQWQSFTAVAKPRGMARPGWKVLRVLANTFHLPDFDYQSSADVRDELKMQVVAMHGLEPAWVCPTQLNGHPRGLVRVADWPIYRTDMLVRRAQALQQSGVVEPLAVRINATLAAELQVSDGQLVQVEQTNGSIELPVAIDNRVPAGAVWLSAGYSETHQLNDLFGPIEITAVDTDSVDTSEAR